MAWIPNLAQELLHAASSAKEKNQKNKTSPKPRDAFAIHCSIVIATNFKQLECLSVRFWMNKFCNIHITEYYAAVKKRIVNHLCELLWSDHQDIRLKKSKAEKSACGMVCYNLTFFFNERIKDSIFKRNYCLYREGGNSVIDAIGVYLQTLTVGTITKQPTQFLHK